MNGPLRQAVPATDPPVAAAAPQRVALRISAQACRAITAAAGSNFPVAFRLLPRPRRQAMNALYAFLRVTDDLADEAGEIPAKRQRLASWRAGLLAALDGRFTHAIFPALADTLTRYHIPVRLLLDVISGVEADLQPARFPTFADLYPYCYRVASAVGLACVRVWGLRPGVRWEEADDSAEAAGIAFQLTNILRDLGEDLARGRVYLPTEELARFRSPPETWGDPRNRAAFRELMAFQTRRAREFYRRGSRLDRLLSDEGRGIFRVMSGTYSRLLDEIERGGFDVLDRRVRVPRWRKGLVLLSGWLARHGWG
jgi:phytoene synthase